MESVDSGMKGIDAFARLYAFGHGKLCYCNGSPRS